MVRAQISWEVKNPHFLVTCIILSHTVPRAPAMEAQGSPREAQGMCELLAKWGRLCPVLIWWKMSLEPGTPQWPASGTEILAESCSVGRSIREGCWGGWDLSVVYSQESLSRSLTARSSCQKCEDTKPTSVQSNPFQCPHRSHRLELENKKSTKPQILGFLAWLGNIDR